ncbi:hypothetical protein AAFF_G00263820 [Aldrovandia affinis]|uniref:Motilin/ghrelin-associated peptide domain-containing protein n=1 Tax=Aldrovandia affinis TaxID=143900 RepID=A0AAD7SSV4_9TELE|nr:hypothetical protein AAFF_G00263820 [Aldrovandia affinis]
MRLMKSRAHGMLLVCLLALWTDTALAGSSFLSPSQKPQGKEKKPPRVGRRGAEGILDLFERHPSEMEENKRITFKTPFEIGITMTEQEFQQYGEVLQRFMQDVLMDAPATG